MAVKLNDRAYKHAQKVMSQRAVVLDKRDDWSEHQPSAEDENQFIEQHGFDAYSKWYLAIDDEKGEHTKGRYRFPYGDFEKIHRCAVLSAESRAGQYGYTDVELALAHLHGGLDALG
jgi:hypothetical protein